MSFSLEDVKRAASLARLEISDAESQQILDQLSGVFELIAKMESVDTEGVEPMAHAQDIVARLRADVVTESDKHELFQSIAPAVDADLYLVPKVIE
jgi:aspartyl-tRNA(Asn)/glutamyl-tRNA(Gln) amidotransferase subunit C